MSIAGQGACSWMRPSCGAKSVCPGAFRAREQRGGTFTREAALCWTQFAAAGSVGLVERAPCVRLRRTLAPIVADREHARMRTKTAQLLDQVCRVYPCAVISGRSKADVGGRLGNASVKYIIGNHG